MMIGALTRAAFAAVITPPIAAGISTSTSSSSNLLVGDSIGVGIAVQQPLVFDGVAQRLGNIEAVGADSSRPSNR